MRHVPLRRPLSGLSAGGLALAAALLGAAPAGHAAASPGTTYHLACGRGDDSASGLSPRTAWNSLARADATVFAPGDRLLLDRGTHCTGTLHPLGSGRAGLPIRVDAYGAGAAPVVDGDGASETVLLRNQEYWEIRDLDITNAAAPGSNRRGVHILLDDYGDGHHYVLQHLTIHDVRGDNRKFDSASGGIVVESAGTAKPSAAHDVRILDSTVRAVDREGIYTWSTWRRRPELGDYWPGGGPFRPLTGLVVRGNRLSDIGGDGIVAKTSTGALVEHNRLAGFNVRSGTYNAGMWTANSDGSVFRYNETSGGRTHLDGMAYDVDNGTRGAVFEHNLSHDNAGGFLLLCNTETETLDGAVVRDNVSRDDGYRGVENCAGPIQGADIHDNTIVIGPHTSQTVVNENVRAERHVRFHDNTVVNRGDPAKAGFHLLDDGYTFAGNTFVGLTEPPTQPGHGG